MGFLELGIFIGWILMLLLNGKVLMLGLVL